MYFMQLGELALIMQDNSASPKIKPSEPLRLVAKLIMQNSWFPGFSGRRCLGLTGLVSSCWVSVAKLPPMDSSCTMGIK